MIMRVELRAIVARLSCMVPEASDKPITFEMGPVEMLCIPTLLGVVQTFPVGIIALHPSEAVEGEAIQASYS